MKAVRAKESRMIETRLHIHSLLMRQFMEQGLTLEAASKKAYHEAKAVCFTTDGYLKKADSERYAQLLEGRSHD